MEIAGADAVVLYEDFIRLDGLQISKSASSADDQLLLKSGFLNAGSRHHVSNCLFRQAGNNSYAEPGIKINDPNCTLYVWNTIIYGLGTRASGSNNPITVDGSTLSVYSSTLTSGYIGIYRASGTVVAKNVYVGNTSNDCYSGTITKTTCASDDGTGSTGLQNIAYDTTEGAGHARFTNVTAGSEDFTLKAGSALVGAGTDEG